MGNERLGAMMINVDIVCKLLEEMAINFHAWAQYYPVRKA